MHASSSFSFPDFSQVCRERVCPYPRVACVWPLPMAPINSSRDLRNDVALLFSLIPRAIVCEALTSTSVTLFRSVRSHASGLPPLAHFLHFRFLFHFLPPLLESLTIRILLPPFFYFSQPSPSRPTHCHNRKEFAESRFEFILPFSDFCTHCCLTSCTSPNTPLWWTCCIP